MKRAAFILILAATFAAPASSDEQRSYTRRTSPGQNVEINWHFYVNERCHPTPPAVTVTSAPAHGRVEIGTAIRKAPEATVGMSACTGQEVNGSLITYTPDPGFIGDDHFTYDRKLPTNLLHATITVRVR
jgi:hypothetical protein